MSLDFKNLSKFYLSNKNIISWYNNIIDSSKKELKNISNKKPKKLPISLEKDYKTIFKKDKLFWAYFYIINGEFQYELIHNDFSIEKLNKIELVKIIRENKQLLKKRKIKINIIEDQLLNSVYIDPITFNCICIINNINFILQEKNFYWENIVDDKEIYIVKFDEKKSCIYVGNNVENEINKIKKKCIKAEINKKIKSIANYKLHEIKDMANKLNICQYKESGKKKTKKDIYSEIQQFI